MKRRILTCLSVLLLGTVALASISDDMLVIRKRYNDPIQLGVWNSNWERSLAYAEEKGIPLIAVWSNGEYCGHCVNFEQCVMSPVFRDWMPKSGFVFYLGMVYDGSYGYTGGTGPSADGKEGYHGASYYWCCNWHNLEMNWPYVRVYWKPRGAAVAAVDEVRSGGQIDGDDLGKPMRCSYNDNRTDEKNYIYPGDYGTYNPGGRRTIATFTEFLRNYKPVPDYNGGEFAAVDYRKSRSSDPNNQVRAGMAVEMTETADTMLIPFTRTNTTTQANAATNYLRCTYPSGANLTYLIPWKKADKLYDLQIEIPQGALVGGKDNIELLLYNDRKEIVASNAVKIVDSKDYPNSPANPYFINDRALEGRAPGAGEWTMDIDAATNGVNAAVKKGKKAYTLLLFGGSTWCPDCQVLDECVFTTELFKKWAISEEHRIACVAIDEPAFAIGETHAPCLLSHETASTEAGKVYFSGVSGSSYLTRHRVSQTEAAYALKRNRQYVERDTLHGGFCLPQSEAKTEQQTGGWRTGLPCLIILRPDGSVAGRIYQLSNDGRSKVSKETAPMLLRRLDEIIAQAEMDGSHEEDNDTAQTKLSKISARDQIGIKETLSFSDQVDYFKVASAPVGTEVTLSLSGTTPVKMILSVVDGNETDPDEKPLVVATNLLTAADFRVNCKLTSDNCYVKVSLPLDDKCYPVETYFALNKDGSTLCDYTLRSDCVLVMKQTKTGPYEITDGIDKVSVSVIWGEKYKFDGLDNADASVAENFLYDAVEDVYTALTTGPVTLKLLPDGGGKLMFGYQHWVPGEVVFADAFAEVTERGDAQDDDFSYEIRVKRRDGLSGLAEAKIKFVPDESSYYKESPTFVFEDDGKVLSWPETEGTVAEQTVRVYIKANTYADGKQILTFRLESTENSDAKVDETQRFVLYLTDDDKPIRGKIRMVTAVDQKAEVSDADIPASRTIVARGGTSLILGFDRIEGASGALKGSVLLDGNKVGEISWLTRDAKRAYVKDILVPPYDVASANTHVLTLVGEDGAVIDSAAKYLTVKVVPERAAVFTQNGVKMNLVRYVILDRLVQQVPVDRTSVEGADEISIAKLSGSLAPGLNWIYDEQDKAIDIWGIPTTAGKFTAVFQVSRDGQPGGTVQVVCEVSDPVSANPSQSKSANPHLLTARTISDIMVVNSKGDRLEGLLSVTVPRSGRCSAKFRSVSGVVTPLMSESWLSCDDGDYSTYLFEDDICVQLIAKVTGEIEVAFWKGDDRLTCIVPDSTWSRSHPASAWKGYYTVSMPIAEQLAEVRAFACGDAYATVKMTSEQAVNSGKMTYAGVLPNGKAFSGVGVLTASGTDAWLPMMYSSDTDTMMGVLRVSSKGGARRIWSKLYPRWEHAETGLGVSYDVVLDAYGTAYDSTVDFANACLGSELASTRLVFFGLGERAPVYDCFASGKAENLNTNKTAVLVKSADIVLVDAAGAKEATGLKLTFNRSTGLVQGYFRVNLTNEQTSAISSANAVFRGVVMPGWGTPDCAVCKEIEQIKRPFCSGSCWFEDVCSDEFLKSGARPVSVKRGFPFSIGLDAGK